VKVPPEALGKRIEIARLMPPTEGNNADGILFIFEDGSGLKLEDTMQSCCETRYMTCGDDLATYTGDKITNVEISDGPFRTRHRDGRDGLSYVHEVQFLRIHTTGGVIVCETHNEHNGYYGGFSLRATYQDNMS
jgi:hypothetical protein